MESIRPTVGIKGGVTRTQSPESPVHEHIVRYYCPSLVDSVVESLIKDAIETV